MKNVNSRAGLRMAAASALTAGALFLAPGAASGAEFSVTPIRVDLRPGVMSETVTVTNHANARLRVKVRLLEWTQDATGADVYKDSSDLVYFPRQMDLEPESKRLVRVGLKVPGGLAERTYRLFIEEEPDLASEANRAQVAFHFKFGVPVFIPPAVPKVEAEVAEPVLQKGRISVAVKNNGNQHFRLARISLSDGAGWAHDIAGWYSLAGSQRTYAADMPREVCRKARVVTMTLEGEGLRFERSLHVDPANCG